jgi:carboxyl-terminal processing protease
MTGNIMNLWNFSKVKILNYQTLTETHLAQLIITAREEQYYESSRSAFDELEKKIALDKDKDFENHRDEIKLLLREEIAGRYYYQKGRIEASLQGDPNLEKAIEVLNDISHL